MCRLALGMIVAAAWSIPGPWAAVPVPPIERLVGVYLQQAIEVATVGDRPIHLTRMTSFRACGRRGAVAEDFNTHVVEVIGRDVAAVGFVAGIVDAIDRCSSHAAARASAGGER
jgi:hypothetical protein